MQPGEILETEAPFVQAPLIDKATSMGYHHCIVEVTSEEYIIYFIK